MNPALFNSQVFIVALPIMVTFAVAAWASASTNNKRIDDLRAEMNHRFEETNRRLFEAKEESNRRFDEVIRRLGRIEDLLANHDQRLTRLEERTSLVGRH